MLNGGPPHAKEKGDSQIASPVSKVFCSPSKIVDLRRYFSLYPEHLLPTDLFVDFLIYETITVAEKAYGGLLYRGDIDRMPWKKQVEDLLNSDSLELDAGYDPSPEELTRYGLFSLTGGLDHLGGNENPQDLALVALRALAKSVPLSVRSEEAGDWHLARRIVEVIRGTDDVDAARHDSPPTQDAGSQVAKWMIKFTMPSLYAARVASFYPLGCLPPREGIKFSPDELVALLCDASALKEFRDEARRLAALRYPTEAVINAEIAAKRRAMQKRLKIASFLFEGMDLLLMPIPEPFSRIASLALKAGQHLTSRSLEKGGRWLLHMEEIDTRIQRDT